MFTKSGPPDRLFIAETKHTRKSQISGNNIIFAYPNISKIQNFENVGKSGTPYLKKHLAEPKQSSISIVFQKNANMMVGS